MKINDIKSRKYEGYVWFSDHEKPKVLHNESYDFSKHNNTENPFIIEALLYANDENISVSVKHTGKYQIHEIDLNDLPEGADFQEIKYLPHRLNGVKKVKFKQLWLPEEDENCNNWEVLKMKALVFTGFEPKN